MILELLFQMVMAFFSCVAFSVIFNAPRKELPFCGISGSIGWVVYFFINELFAQSVLATFLAAVAVTMVCRYFSYMRQAPSTMYHIAGILPLVPGMSIYNAMSGILDNDLLYCFAQGVMALKLASAIAIGSIVVLSLPKSFFVHPFHSKHT